jgi:hypothetical protein
MNSAQRLEKLFAQLRGTTPSTSIPNNPPSAVDAWAVLFDRHGQAGPELDVVAAECALAVGHELNHLGHLLEDRSVPMELYRNHIAQLREVTSTRYLHGQSQQLASMIREEQLVMMQWAGFVLGEDHSGDIEEDVQRLSIEVDQLIADVQGSQMPSTLRSFILRNLRLIRDALWRYKASGAEPLRAAMQTVNGTSEREVANLRPVVEELDVPDTNIMQRVGQLIGSVANACDVATKIQGGFALGATALTALGITS